MPLPVLLAADLIEILARGIPIILFVLWLIGQAMSERQKQVKPVPRQAKPATPPPAAQRERSEIEDEIDAFLRRASEKKGQPQGRRSPEETVILVPPKQERGRPQGEGAPQRGDPARTRQASLGRPRTQPGQPLRPTPQQAAAPRPQPTPPRPSVLAENRPLRGTSLGSLRPLQDVGTSGATPELASEISLADEKMQAHLQSVFDHRLGTLQHREVAPTQKVAGSPIAESVVKMLRDPQGVQQLIVANEILRRPEF